MRKVMLVVVCLSAVGCVSSGKYDAAVAELRACKADGDDQKNANAQLAKAKAESDEKLRQLNAELRDLGTESQKLQNEKGSLAEGMTKLQSELMALRRQEEAERARAAVFQDLVNKLKGMIDAGKLQVYIRNGRMLVKLPDNVLFDPGKTDIKPAGKDAIAQLTGVLQAIPDRNFQVAGHTDNTPIHTAKFASNWELSTERAVMVVQFMIKSGMESRRLSAAGLADNDPVAPNDSPAGKAQNRRIEVELLPNLAELPKFEDPSKTAAR
jgi:chemotaxis protein MotB